MRQWVVLTAMRFLPKPVAYRIAAFVPGEWQEAARMWIYWTGVTNKLRRRGRQIIA